MESTIFISYRTDSFADRQFWGGNTLKQMSKINLFLSKFHNSGIMEDAPSHLNDPCQHHFCIELISALVYNTKD